MGGGCGPEMIERDRMGTRRSAAKRQRTAPPDVPVVMPAHTPGNSLSSPDSHHRGRLNNSKVGASLSGSHRLCGGGAGYGVDMDLFDEDNGVGASGEDKGSCILEDRTAEESLASLVRQKEDGNEEGERERRKIESKGSAHDNVTDRFSHNATTSSTHDETGPNHPAWEPDALDNEAGGEVSLTNEPLVAPDSEDEQDMLEPFGGDINIGMMGAPADMNENIPDFEHVSDREAKDKARDSAAKHSKCHAESPSANDCQVSERERMVAFAMGMHTRLGKNSLVCTLNSNILHSILVCDLIVGPTRHFSSLHKALRSGHASCATVVRVRIEPGVYGVDFEAQVKDRMSLHVCPVPGSAPGSVILSSHSGRPLLRVANSEAFVTVQGIHFVSSCNRAATELQPSDSPHASTTKQRCIWVTDGKLVLRDCTVSSQAGIGICVIKDGLVRCERCTVSDCGFVGVAATKGGRAEVVDGCQVVCVLCVRVSVCVCVMCVCVCVLP